MAHIFAQTDTGGSGTMEMLTSSASKGIDLLGNIFLCVIGIILAVFIVLFLIDILQTKDAVRRNYPVIGRFRGLFSTLGEFFRQYFFAMDREEMPFNRAERDWINDVAKEGSSTEPFGSTRRLSPGSAIFANGMFPKLDEEFEPTESVIIGPDTRRPYQPYSFFNVSAMSYGSLSQPAIRALSMGANLAGCWLNTGEGGLSPYHLEGNCDIVFQLGTAKFGARNDDGSLNVDKLVKITTDHPNVRMIEVKLSQGAKPGKGGILPAEKVTPEIAEIRGIPVGESAISPNRHVDASTPEELLDLIHTMREATGIPVGIKFVVGNIADVEALLIAIKARGAQSAPDFFTIDGGDGGTGAAPMPLLDNVGLTIREGLPAVDDLLMTYGLHERVRIIASGKLVTPAEVAWAFAAGADFVNSGRGFMFALGCIQAMKCNENTCPTGITTHNKRLQRGLDPENKATRVMHYCKSIRKDVEMISHSCGVDHPRQLRREHVLIVQDNGRSLPFSQVWGQRPRIGGKSKEST